MSFGISSFDEFAYNLNYIICHGPFSIQLPFFHLLHMDVLTIQIFIASRHFKILLFNLAVKYTIYIIL